MRTLLERADLCIVGTLRQASTFAETRWPKHSGERVARFQRVVSFFGMDVIGVRGVGAQWLMAGWVHVVDNEIDVKLLRLNVHVIVCLVCVVKS